MYIPSMFAYYDLSLINEGRGEVRPYSDDETDLSARIFTNHVCSNGIFGMKWVVVRVFGASIAGKLISRRGGCNGKGPGTERIIYFY